MVRYFFLRLTDSGHELSTECDGAGLGNLIVDVEAVVVYYILGRQ